MNVYLSFIFIGLFNFAALAQTEYYNSMSGGSIGVAISDGDKSIVEADPLHGKLSISPPTYYIKRRMGLDIGFFGLGGNIGGGKALPMNVDRYFILLGEPNDFVINNFNISCVDGELSHVDVNLISYNVESLTYATDMSYQSGIEINGYLLSHLMNPDWLSAVSRQALLKLQTYNDDESAKTFANSFCLAESREAMKSFNLESWQEFGLDLSDKSEKEFSINYKKAKNIRKRALIELSWNPNRQSPKIEKFVEENKEFLKKIRDFINNDPRKKEIELQK